MSDDTKIGGFHHRFPATRLSALLAVRSEDSLERQAAFETLVSAYWKPVYKYVRIQWNKSNEDAKDLTQEFFALAMEKGFFQTYDPSKAKFRTFVRTCIDGFVSNEEKAARCLKRGGHILLLSLDFDDAEHELRHIEPPAPDDLETYFEKEWIRNLFSLSLAALRGQLLSSGKEVYFLLFERYLLNDSDGSDRTSYKGLAEEFGLAVSQVTNYLAFSRREFRRIVLEKLRELTVNDEEFRSEAWSVLGVDVP